MSGYTLAEGVYFVAGATRGAIYDTNTGNVFSVNGIACKILEKQVRDDEFWMKLANMHLAVPTVNDEKDQRDLPRHTLGLEFISFEVVSEDCNQCCIHCYASSAPPSYRKAVGLSSPLNLGGSKSGRRLRYREWLDLIREGYALGCRRGQFIGGEPFLYRGEDGKTILDLAAYARELGYESIEIFTNATLLTPRKVSRIKELALHMAVSLYSADATVHDAITKTPGSHRKTIAALEMLKAAGVPTRVEVIIMCANQHTVDKTLQLIEEMGFGHKPPDIVRPKGRGDDPCLMPDNTTVARYGLVAKPNFRTDLGFLARSYSGHNCLAGKIAVTDRGDVLPCIFSRNQVVGNVVLSRSLTAIIAGEALQTVWHTTKDRVLVCQDCEYRYTCFDCRPLSQAVSGGEYLSAPYPRCTYNPYTGEWGGGTWKLTDGKPYYDESIKTAIEEMAIQTPL